MYTPVVEDYLKAVWMLQQVESPVSTSRIAERLGLTSAAVTAMIKRLAEQNLLRHEPYYGVRLTGAGELAALRIIRRHRVLELFLAEKLGYEWDRVHEEAERLEHAASDELIERLARLLGEPERDPHGNVIPSATGEFDRSHFPSLGDLTPGTPSHIVEVEVDDPEQLRYLGSLNLYPGTGVEVVSKSPFEGPISLTVNGEAAVISYSLAQRIRVRADDDDEPEEGGAGEEEQARPAGGEG
ncbi:MAG TPA: metal-dependent transcriptional regulator [Longimicrobiaceae bacterium]|nr:metal-dependent transcriptional regulator [Longimicrobiaceae bacterium]